MNSARETLDQVFRTHVRTLTAALTAGCGGDVLLAEEALQDACAAALQQWDQTGIPQRPEGWLLTVARRKAIDRIRRAANFRNRTEVLRNLAAVEEEARRGEEDPALEAASIRDSRLRLIFMCCHPSLSVEAQLALTLQTVAGLDAETIAKAFVAPTATIAQRIVRAKRKIREANIPFRVPGPAERPQRLGAVLAVVYLVFNEGYLSSRGSALIRDGLCVEAIRLAELVAGLCPEEAEVRGLLALMMLHHARRDARQGPGGELIPLEKQDRQLWHGDEIRRGTAILEAALAQGPGGPFLIQGAIAALHCEAKTAASTDWAQIAALYGELERLQPTAIVRLNRAVAIGMARGPSAGLALLEDPTLKSVLSGYYLYHAARGDLLRRQGGGPERTRAAALAYRRALELAKNEVERRFLHCRLAPLEAEITSGDGTRTGDDQGHHSKRTSDGRPR